MTSTTTGRYVRQGDVGSRAAARAEQITIFRANVEVYTPDGEGGSYVEYHTCRHQHTSAAGAEACARGIARRERARAKAARGL